MSRSVALASTTAVPAIASPALATPVGPKLSLEELIEVHKAAFERVSDAYSRLESLQRAVDEDRQKNPILVPFAVMPNGKCYGGYCEYPPLTRDEIRKRIKEYHVSLRTMHCSKWSHMMFPDFAAAMEAELEASQARALQALADAEASMAARRSDAGLSDLQQTADAANEEEVNARLALALFLPRDEQEATAKRTYIEEAPPFRDGWCDDSDFVEALLDGLSHAPDDADASATA